MNKRIEYTTHDYLPYNEAVRHELAHHREIAAAVHEESRLRRAKVWVLISLAIAILGLTLAVIYWLFSQPEANQIFAASSPKTRENLGAIAASENPKGIEVATSFNVFDKTPMATGEIVVTSKEFTPANLSQPQYQYCYVTNSTEISNATQILIADVEGGQVRVQTTDTFLLESALPLCTFIQSGY